MGPLRRNTLPNSWTFASLGCVCLMLKMGRMDLSLRESKHTWGKAQNSMEIDFANKMLESSNSLLLKGNRIYLKLLESGWTAVRKNGVFVEVQTRNDHSFKSCRITEQPEGTRTGGQVMWTPQEGIPSAQSEGSVPLRCEPNSLLRRGWGGGPTLGKGDFFLKTKMKAFSLGN